MIFNKPKAYTSVLAYMESNSYIPLIIRVGNLSHDKDDFKIWRDKQYGYKLILSPKDLDCGVKKIKNHKPIITDLFLDSHPKYWVPYCSDIIFNRDTKHYWFLGDKFLRVSSFLPSKKIWYNNSILNNLTELISMLEMFSKKKSSDFSKYTYYTSDKFEQVLNKRDFLF